MVPVRPEFFYHPAVGVISPASLGLFAFKSGPLTVTTPPSQATILPKAPQPPERSIPALEVAPTILNTASPMAIAADTPSPLTTDKDDDMKKSIVSKLGVETCIVTGEELPIEKMIRFVVDPKNNIMADLSEKLPAQGFWIKASRDVIKKAIWRNSFTTANRSPVNIPKDLLENIELGLLKQSLETIGLAKKAGLVTQGFAKVEELLKKGGAVLYIVASDAMENGREKLERMADKANLPILETWTSSQLSASLGVDNAVHVALTPGGLTDKLLTIAHKMKDIR